LELRQFVERAVTVATLTLLALTIAFGAEVGWLVRC
jgi:hypothetical protein